MKPIKLLVITTLLTIPTLAQIPITVMTYNIFGGKGADGVADDEDIPRLGRVIKAQAPDLLGLQESWVDQASKIGSLAELSNVEWAAPNKVGEAVLSNFTLKNVREILLPPDDSRMLIFSEVEVTGSTGAKETVVFITTHFTFNDDAAKLESAKIIDSVFNAHYDNNQPAIFTGDLNSGKESEPINYMDQSWVIVDFSFKIDWIMYRPAERWKVLSVSEIDTGEALQASDHKPVVLKLEYRFQTGIGTIEGSSENASFNFAVINTPENQRVRFQFTGNELLPASIRILNSFGKTVKVLHNNQSGENKLHTIAWDYSGNVPSGKYHCFFKAGSLKDVKSLMVIK